MIDAPKITTSLPPGRRLRSLLSLLCLGLVLTLLVSTYFLMSPPAGGTYPGAIPWRPGSLLHRVTDVMSLYGLVGTIRGVEIKDLAFHLATVAALLLLAGRALVSGLLPPDRRTAKGAWFLGQVFLVGWVLVSLLSSRWSGDPPLSLGQAAVYGLALAWAVALAWTLESRDVPRLLWGYVIVTAAGAALCIWYYHERNPYHNPGFPIGNPNSLAACLVPALLIAGAALLGSVDAAWRERGSVPWTAALAAVLCLVPLCWCFHLAGSLGALVGLVMGVVGLVLLLIRRRLRWTVLLIAVLVGSLGALYVSYARQSSVQDFVMARGETIRFRLYAWRYAAVLWSRRPVSGVGAGQYPRLAGGLSVGDRVLDPAAFPAELVEHAHNELFEIFAEIGLVGGVTFVAGFVATLAAASALLRANLSLMRRWLLLGLVAGLMALLGDFMFGVGLRLPGVPAVFFTLLGVLWAMCRSVSRQRPREESTSGTWLRRMVLRHYGVAAVSVAAALGAGWLALRNWSGVQREEAAAVAYQAGEYESSLAHARAAQARLLDPVRQLIAGKQAVDCQFARARVAHGRFMAIPDQARAPDTQGAAGAASADEADALREQAAARCDAAYAAALALSRRASNFGRMESIGAHCAEMAAVVSERGGRTAEAREWGTRAFQAWRSQRFLRPFDLTTLLKLAGYLKHYRSLTGEYIGLLRDALRNGFARPEWYAALREGPSLRDFEATLVAMLRSVGPYVPETDLDALILSRAPEMYRFSAAWKALRGAYQDAAADAARAAMFYRSMRARFPELYSVALAEEAEYVFQARPDDARPAVALLREAIDALPRIQKQKHEAMLMPYELRLARFLLAAGEHDEADELLRSVLHRQPDNLQAWVLTVMGATERRDVDAVRATLRDAAEAGLGDEELEGLRRIVQQNLPEALESPERPRD